MEICGGHTHAIYRHGLHDLLPAEVELVHGPGCPVCVIPLGRVDDAIAIAETEGVTLATFGDMLRVPGGRGTLLEAKARGADVRMVYSPLDALALARRSPTATSASSRSGSRPRRPPPQSRCAAHAPSGHQLLGLLQPRADRAAAARDPGDARPRVDAFIGPGHVSSVIGTDAYRFVVEEHGRPVVVTAFEPLDLLQAIAMILRQRADGRCEIENQYTRVVRPAGNPRALEAIDETMEVRDDFEWRGLGALPRSALRLREAYAPWDAERLFTLPGRAPRGPEGMPLRRGADRADQAVGVRCLRHRLHPGAPARDVHGLERGRVRRVLRLRAPATSRPWRARSVRRRGPASGTRS